ncbi:MAG: DUF3127 domain-containing protein [Bacteroidales bacterium]|jgi:hypothetical protein|nr:DUF3127 domain-containing protein [Bacteroidales bacterium]
MEIKGKLVEKLMPQTGQGKNGEWKKQDIIIETEGTYPKKVCITIWGDKVDVASLVEGSMLNVSFDIESREFNGKWYTNVTGWKVDPVNLNQNSSELPPLEMYQNDPISPEGENVDDLPF